MIGADYTCAHCRGTYAKTTTDAEALAEYAALFPDRGEAVVIVCDPCWRKFFAKGVLLVERMGE